MEYKFEKKFGEKHIDHFISSFYNNYKANSNDEYIFNLENVEWISNQGLLLITSLLKFLYSKEVRFKMIFFELNNSQTINYRRSVINIINLWEVWKINRVVPDDHKWNEYFSFKNSKLSFTPTLLEALKKQFNINVDQNLYNRLRITPFVELEKVNNYIDEKIIDTQISPIFKLNNEISSQLRENNCEHPFLNNTLSHIITKELYENFLDHVNDSFFQTEKNWAFMSLSLKRNLAEDNQYILKKNFEEEELESTKNFFYKNDKYLNHPIIEYSFLDFGEGIVSTLRENFKENFETDKFDDNEILKYSFEYYSSRHPIKNYTNYDDAIIPRGLYDVLTIVKRYSGIIIIRSNYGKILFDYSSKDQKKSINFFGDNTEFFPGTFINIYLPAFVEEQRFDSSSIKPQINDFKNRTPIIRYINLNEIYKKVTDTYNKDQLYNKLIENLRDKIKNKKDSVYINCISFNECHDERLNKIILFFLLTNYEINLNNNVIIFFPPSREFIENIKIELINLSSTTKSFAVHPIPLVYDEDNIDWLGIFDEKDKENLSHFFDEFVIKSIDEFENPDELLGNFQYLEGQRNLHSLLSKVNIPDTLNTLLIKNILDRNKCIRKDGLYLCNGNYYQNEFIQLLELLNNDEDCKIITSILFDKIGTINNDTYFIAITSSSHKILNTLIKMNLITKDRCLFLDSYLTFENDIKTKELFSGQKYILFGDVLSGGSLAKRLELVLLEKECKLEKIAVLINTVDEDYENTKMFLKDYKSKIVYAYKYKIKKFKRHDIDPPRLNDVIRINPYTNLPNIFSDDNTLKNSILFSDSNREFLDYINEEDILINYKVFNNLIHPYFFKLEEIIKKENDLIKNNIANSLINHILNSSLKAKVLIDENLKIFYPKGSDIETLDFDYVKSKILNNHAIDIFELERFSIKEGWKFPHTTDAYRISVLEKNVLILDDGSCSGDSILQMVNELAYFKPKKIDVISLIGRVDDHKREFFSRIKQMRFEQSSNNYIDVNIYFASHWHISAFFIDSSPFSGEIKRLHTLLTFQNLPTSIKKIANFILVAISPDNSTEKDYPFFPRGKENNRVPKKDIILVRNEIGKVIGYRFYRENFIFFNEFIKNYTETDRGKDRYKKVELLCMCLLYEPYLYERLTNIMPDIKEKVEEFIDAIFFGIKNRPKLNINLLYYNWNENKKDLLHLFFIIYSNENKLKQLNNDKITDLLNFSKLTFKKTNPCNYILYKLINFFPLLENEIEEKSKFNFLKETLLNYISSDDAEPQTKIEFKRFYSFLNTLPTGGDFTSQVQRIKDVYWENDLPKTHAENTSYGQSLTKFIINLEELKDYYKEHEKPDLVRVNVVRESWNNIKDKLLDNIISFFRTFPDFFKPYPYLEFFSKMDGKKNSLINLYSEIDDFVSNIEQKSSNLENFDKTILSMENINENFGQTSVIRNLFDINYMNFFDFKNYLFNEFSILKNIKNINDLENYENLKILIPELYCKEVIIKELKDNIDFYSDKSKEIQIKIIPQEKTIILEIINYYTETIKEFSGNEGINCMMYLSDSPLFNFKYSNEADNNNKTFTQNLIFNV